MAEAKIRKEYGWYDYFDIVEQLFEVCETVDDLTERKDKLKEILIRHYLIAKDDLQETLH